MSRTQTSMGRSERSLDYSFNNPNSGGPQTSSQGPHNTHYNKGGPSSKDKHGPAQASKNTHYSKEGPSSKDTHGHKSQPTAVSGERKPIN